MACMLDTEQPLCQNGYDGTVVVVVVVNIVFLYTLKTVICC